MRTKRKLAVVYKQLTYYSRHLRIPKTVLGLFAVFLLVGCDTVTNSYPTFPSISPVSNIDGTPYTNQWALPQLSAQTAWGVMASPELTSGAATSVVAVIDTMFDLSHPDLANVWLTNGGNVVGWDFISDDAIHLTGSPTMEEADHGTHVAGIVAAERNNSLGVAGIAGNSVRIMPIRVLETRLEGSEIVQDGSFSDLLSAMRYAGGFQNSSGAIPPVSASVITMSLGAGGAPAISDQFEALIDDLRAAGVTMVAAAGNATRSSIDYPAAYPGVLAVGSVDADETRSYFSNYGALLDFVAPGGDNGSTGIWSTLYDGGSGNAYGSLVGTSMSTPYVAGILGLMKTLSPDLGTDEAYRVLAETSKDLGATARDDHYGWGLVNAERALKRLVMTPYGPYALEPNVIANGLGPITSIQSSSGKGTPMVGETKSTETIDGSYIAVLDESKAKSIGPAALATEMAGLSSRIGATKNYVLSPELWFFRIPEMSLESVRNSLLSSPLVESVVPDTRISLSGGNPIASVDYSLLARGTQGRVSTPKAELHYVPDSLEEAEWVDTLAQAEREALLSALQNDSTIVALFAGERPTGGFGIRINEVAARGETLYVDYQVTEPDPGTLVTQALTSPFAIIRVSGEYTRLESRDPNETEELQD